MKKFLSLALALVMTMSLVTIGASAKEFKDDSSIDYSEAVAVVSEIGVVDGYADGNFNPQNVLTRGAAAKIICNMILGPTTASALTADAASFKDVPANHEFAGYIAYCAQKGIINGYSDGTFRPAGTLNGYSFMKMLLGALGYDGTIEGFTGPNWTIQVAKLALGNKLTSGNDDFDGNAAVTREEACLYAFNTLKADVVEYDSKTTVSINGANVTIGNSEAKKIASEEDAGYKDTLDKENLQFAEQYFPKLTRTLTDTDAFGRPSAEWKYKSAVIGNYVDKSDLIATYTAKLKKGDLYSLVGSGTVSGLKESTTVNNKVVYTYDLVGFVDGEEVYDNTDAEDLFVKNSSAAVGASGNGVVTEVYMDDDNNVRLVQIRTYLAKATADYNEKKGTLSIEAVETNEAAGLAPAMGTTIDNDDVNVEEFKEDDYILITYAYERDGRGGSVQTAEKAEVLTGAVSKYTERDNVVIDGTTYKYNAVVGTGTENEKGVEYTIGEDATVVLDAYGYIIYVDESVSTSSYVWIQDTAYTTGLNKTVIAGAFLTDGTYDEVTLNKVNGKTDSSKLYAADGWYTYSKNSAGKYTLSNTKLTLGDANTQSAAGKIIENGKVRFVVADSSIKANSSTVMIVIDEDGDPTVYTGITNIPDITATGAVRIEWVANSSGYAKYVVVDLSDEGTKSDVDDKGTVADYLMILSPTNNKTVEADDKTYYEYDVILDGEETTKYIEESIADAKSDDVLGKLFYNVKSNSDGYVTSATEFGTKVSDGELKAVPMSDVAISYSGDTLTIGTDSYIVATGTKSYLVIGEGVEDLLKDPDADYETYMGISAKALAGTVKGYDLDGTAYLILDDDDSDVIVGLYVYVSDAVETPEV